MTTFEPDIALYGGPGSGKSTQATLLVSKLGLLHLNMGGQLRKLAATKTPLGLKIKKTIEQGKLLPATVTDKIIEDFIKKAGRRRILFDGCIRNFAQVKGFETMLKKYDRRVVLVLLDLPQKEGMVRISKRSKTEHRADDVDLKAVKERFSLFNTRSKDILRFYKGKKALIKVDATPTPAKILKEIITKVRDIK